MNEEKGDKSDIPTNSQKLNQVKGATVPEYKKEIVKELVEKIKSHETLLLVSTKGLPSSQYQKIKKGLRGKADVLIAKKSLITRAIDMIEKGALQNLKKEIGANVALFFSNIDAFELSGLLSENQSSAKAKAGDIAPEDIKVEPGLTELIPGPAISELSNVGLKVAVENGKLAIKQGATIVKEGEEINENVAGVMAKLNIEPMKVGFIPLAAYDAKEDKVYVGIKIDKEAALEELREAIGKGFGFAVGVNYTTTETVNFFISKAGLEAKALESLSPKEETPKSEEETKESLEKEDSEEVKTEEKKEEVKEDIQNSGKEEAN